MKKTTLIVDGMMCEHCVASVKDSLSAVDGVGSVSVDLKRGTAVVEHEGVADETLAMAILDAGFKAKVKHGLFR